MHVFGHWGLCLPPCCWHCSSCPSSLCSPSRCLTSCRSPSPTHTLHRHAAHFRTSVEYEQDTHLLDSNKASEIKIKRWVVVELVKLQRTTDAHRSVWGGSQHSVRALVLLPWSCCSSGSCCGFRWRYGPLFSNQVLSPSLVSLLHCAQEH